MPLAILLKRYREYRGFTQETVAQHLKISREMLSYYETGSREPGIDLLEKLADLYGVELLDLVEENPDLATVNLAFAFRSENLQMEDMQQISDFQKIIKNYLKMVLLEEKHD